MVATRTVWSNRLILSLALALSFLVVGASIWFATSGPKAIAKPRAVIPRWFPEPQFLLDHSSDLKLSIEQTRLIQVSSVSWRLQRAAFDAQFKSFGSDVSQALSELNSQRSLSGGYAKVVADFDKARLKAWNQATKVLRPDQVLTLETLRHRAEGSKEQNANLKGLTAVRDGSNPEFDISFPESPEMKDLDKQIADLEKLHERHFISDKLYKQGKRAIAARRDSLELEESAREENPTRAHLIPLRPFHVEPSLIPPYDPKEKFGVLVSPDSRTGK